MSRMEEPTGWLSPPKRRGEIERENADLKRQLAEARAEIERQIELRNDQCKRKLTALDERDEARAEIEKLNRHIHLHAGDTASLNNEVETFRQHWLDAEAERDRLAAELEHWQTVKHSSHWKERAEQAEDELRTARAQLDVQLAGHRMTAKDATKQLLRATSLEEAINRVIDPAPGCNCPPWVFGILKAAIAGKE